MGVWVDKERVYLLWDQMLEDHVNEFIGQVT
jgi:hypothetical protein